MPFLLIGIIKNTLEIGSEGVFIQIILRKDFFGRKMPIKECLEKTALSPRCKYYFLAIIFVGIFFKLIFYQ